MNACNQLKQLNLYRNIYLEIAACITEADDLEVESLDILL